MLLRNIREFLNIVLATIFVLTLDRKSQRFARYIIAKICKKNGEMVKNGEFSIFSTF